MKKKIRCTLQFINLIIRINTWYLSVGIALITILLLGTPIFGQERGSFMVRNYTPTEHKSHVQNWATIQDDRGMIYVANGNGILEYNGVDWQLIKTKNNSRIRSFAKDKSGRVYVGAVGDFGYLQTASDGKMSFVSLTDKLNEEDKNFLDVWFVEAIGNDIYFSTYKTLFRFREGKIKTWKTADNMLSCFVVNEQIYVCEALAGIKKLNGDLLELIPFGDFFKDKPFVLALPYEKNKILIGTSKNGLYIFDLDASPTSSKGLVIRKFETEIDEIILKGRPYHGIRLRDGSFAFGIISMGLVIIDKKGQLRYIIDEKSGLLSCSVSDVYEDIESNLWLTQVNGISKVTINPSITHWGNKEGLKDLVLDAVRFNKSMYVACFDGLFKLNSNQAQRISGFESIAFNFLKFNVPNNPSEQLLLASTNFDGIIEVRNNKIITLLPSSTIAFCMIQSKINPSYLYVGKSGALEVAIYENNRFKSLGCIEGINTEVRSIVEKENGDIWITDNIARVECLVASGNILKPKQIIKYTKKDGIEEAPIVFPYKDRVVLGTGLGFYRVDNAMNKFIPDSTFGKKFCDGTIKVTYFKDETPHFKWIAGIKDNHFGVGMQNKKGEYEWFETPFYFIPENSLYSAYFDADSSIWISSANGLYRFKGELEKHCPPFSTSISSATIGKDSIIYQFKNTDETNPLQHKLAKYRQLVGGASTGAICR